MFCGDFENKLYIRCAYGVPISNNAKLEKISTIEKMTPLGTSEAEKIFCRIFTK